eukprot:scaffold710_cov171-Amphora_coffeaeformis.AAC.40
MKRFANFFCLAILSVSMAGAFQLAAPLRVGTSLHSTSADGKPVSTVISPDDVDFQFDTGLGGVRLAQESYIKLNGTIKHKGSSATVSFKDLMRYTGVREVPESQVMEQLEKIGAKVICTGRGQELYKDPGSGADKVVILGPLDAADDAGKGAIPAAEAAEVVINVLGGDDLQFLEVKDALELLVPKLVIGKAKVRFHSLSFSSFPLGQVTITAVALPEDASSNGLHGAEKAIADGEIYFQDGQWWTVVEQDINTALA